MESPRGHMESRSLTGPVAADVDVAIAVSFAH
jgi:hypothetical protein